VTLLKIKHKKKSKHNRNKPIKYIKKTFTITRIQKQIGKTRRSGGKSIKDRIMEKPHQILNKHPKTKQK